MKKFKKQEAFTMAGAGQRTLITGLRACGHAFTMAEILLSLTIIGVVAAITLPSLTGNINERTWNTQRKALLARMSQALALIPALNGYGASSTVADVVDKSAEVFITNALSKVLKINNICSSSNVADCGIPAKLNNATGASTVMPAKISDLNAGLPSGTTGMIIRDAKPAALETANGESILVFYNPYCTASNVIKKGADVSGFEGEYIKQHVCVNFLFDLNGKKGPNTIGKDIGIMTAIYSSDSKLVMPMYPKKLTGTKEQTEAAKACGDIEGGEYRLPNIEEVLSLYYNLDFMGISGDNWSSTTIDADHAWYMGFNMGIRYPGAKSTPKSVVCVKR